LAPILNGSALSPFIKGEKSSAQIIESWASNEALPLLRQYMTTWNESLLPTVNRLVKLWKAKQYRNPTFDSRHLPVKVDDPEWTSTRTGEKVLFDSLFSLYQSRLQLEGESAKLLSQGQTLKGYTPPSTFLSLTDTPASFSGLAGKFLGVDSGGKIQLLTPSLPLTSLLTLTDTPSAYPFQRKVLVSNTGGTDLEWKSFEEVSRWRLEGMACAAPSTHLTAQGDGSAGTLYMINLGDVSCTSFSLTLGPIPNGTRIGVKCIAGTNPGGNTRLLQPDTAQGVSFHDGLAPGSYQLQPGDAYIFRYDESRKTYHLEHSKS